jgi:hypothetical protein
MKRIVALCLAAACLISMVGCAGDTNMEEKKPNSTASAYALALASYPEMAPYPNEMEYFDEKTGEFDSDGFDVVYDAWQADRKAQRSQPEGYADGLEAFFASSIREFLSNSNGANKVYSPINIYMALAMLAEVTDGESRQQILDLLGSESIETLRAQAASVWNANYSNDGAVTSILANSLWLNESVNFNQSTMDSLATNYYASSFRGEMGSEEFTAVLETVFRQASNSRIITNAYAINHNDTHLQFGDDFQFLEVQNSEEAAQLVIKNYLQEVSLHGIEDVQILSPLRKRGAVAANALNETIRDLVNPPNNLKKEVKCGSRVFRVGDRIMQTANRINVSNGDVGVITDMKKEDDETITCVRLLDGRTLQYTQEMLEDLEFSYCTTIHKSQGQEYPVIIVPLLKEHYIMLRRNLLYTAVTRAKAKVILIGQKQAVFVAIHKCDVGQRNTVLADRIVAYYNRELSRRVA